MRTTNILDLNNRVDELEKSYPANKVMMSDGVTSVEDDLRNLDRIVAIPFTTPSDLSSTGIGEDVNIPLSVYIPQNAYIVGVSISVFGQERTIIGEYFGQVGFSKNTMFLINVLKAISSRYNNISGHLLVCVPHN